MLTWSRRMKIALDAAKGLAFLHGAERPVIYRDFKTSNILLNAVSYYISIVQNLLHDKRLTTVFKKKKSTNYLSFFLAVNILTFKSEFCYLSQPRKAEHERFIFVELVRNFFFLFFFNFLLGYKPRGSLVKLWLTSQFVM